MHRKMLTVSGVSAAAILAIASQARATHILVDNTPVILDSYDPEPDGTSPVAQIGVWANPGTPDQVVITHAPADPSGNPPGPFQGTGYLRLGNNSSGVGAAQLGSNVTITSGHTFTWDSEVWVPALETTLSDDYQFIARSGPNNTGSPVILTTLRNGTINNYNGTAYSPTSTTVIGGQWQDWQVQYTVGQPTYSFTIDGQGSTAIPVVAGTAGDGIQSFLLFSNSGTQQSIYLDESGAVPEPASFGLLAVSALGMLLRRRR